MNTRKVSNNLDQSSEDIAEALFSVNDPECQLHSSELLKVFKTNLEKHRDIYLQLTKNGILFRTF